MEGNDVTKAIAKRSKPEGKVVETVAKGEEGNAEAMVFVGFGVLLLHSVLHSAMQRDRLHTRETVLESRKSLKPLEKCCPKPRREGRK